MDLHLYGLQMELAGRSARGNLRETFEIMDTIYSIDDMENGVIKELCYSKGENEMADINDFKVLKNKCIKMYDYFGKGEFTGK
ncbi:MAG: hypothetical protein ACLUZ6_03700 [Lachnospira eligens]